MFIDIKNVPYKNQRNPCKTSQSLWQDNQFWAQISNIRLPKSGLDLDPYRCTVLIHSHTAQCKVPQTPGRHLSLVCYWRKRCDSAECEIIEGELLIAPSCVCNTGLHVRVDLMFWICVLVKTTFASSLV